MPKSIPCTVCWTVLRLHCCLASVTLMEHKECPCQGQEGQRVHVSSCSSWSQGTLVTGYWVLIHSPSPGLRWSFVQLFPSRSGEEGRWTPFSLFPSLLQHCIWAKLKSICIWEGMCAVVGVTSKKDGRVPYVLLHCRFYSFLEICSKILLISCPNNIVVFCTWSVL